MTDRMSIPEIDDVVHEIIMAHHYYQRKSLQSGLISPTITVSGLSHNHCLIALALSLTSFDRSSVLSSEVDE